MLEKGPAGSTDLSGASFESLWDNAKSNPNAARVLYKLKTGAICSGNRQPAGARQTIGSQKAKKFTPPCGSGGVYKSINYRLRHFDFRAHCLPRRIVMHTA